MREELEQGRERQLRESVAGGKDHPELVGDCMRPESVDPGRKLLPLADLYPPLR